MTQLSNYQRIIVGIDGSRQSKRAVQKAIASRNEIKRRYISLAS